MEVKKLIWRDNVTKHGKLIGMVEIISTVDNLTLFYSIRNYKEYNNIYDNKYWFFSGALGDEVCIECDSIEEAKNIAQEHFEKKIMNYFFDSPTKNSYLDRTWIIDDYGRITSKEFNIETIQLMNSNSLNFGILPTDISQKIVNILNGL